MKRAGATVLYEDRAAPGNPKEFGPHNLVLALVADALSRDFYSRAFRESVTGLPMKSNGKVWKACRENLSLLTRTGRSVVAVIDADRVAEMLGPPRPACRRAVLERLRAPCPDSQLLHFVLLEQNLETVLRAITGDDWVDKDVLQRDRLLNRVAYEWTRQQRKTLRARPELGSLCRLVDLLARLA